MPNEVVVPQLGVLSGYLPGGIGEGTRNDDQDVRCPVRDVLCPVQDI